MNFLLLGFLVTVKMMVMKDRYCERKSKISKTSSANNAGMQRVLQPMSFSCSTRRSASVAMTFPEI